jgi:hypothetical protein
VSDPRRALDALMLAIVEHSGGIKTREILADAAGFALRPPSTDPSPDAWHTADVAFGFGGHLLAQELLDTIDRRAQDRNAAAAISKTAKKGTP